MKYVCLTGRILGKVQGVGFRETTVSQARALGLSGWVRNREDGSVEIMFAGEPKTVDTMRDWLSHGPPAARVDEVRLQYCDETPGGVFVRC